MLVDIFGHDTPDLCEPKPGYWNLYGRLLNEGPYATLTFGNRQKPQTVLHGPAFMPAEGGQSAMQTSQWLTVTVKAFRPSTAGKWNLNVVWQMGTLDTYFGDLGLYDFRPAQIFFETVGLSARYQTDKFELLIGGGDSGYFIRRENYNTLFTGGGTLRYRPINRLEVGIGGQYRFEPSVKGNRAAPYSTPDIGYEDVIRGEVLLNYTEENPYCLLEFPIPSPPPHLR